MPVSVAAARTKRRCTKIFWDYDLLGRRWGSTTVMNSIWGIRGDATILAAGTCRQELACLLSLVGICGLSLSMDSNEYLQSIYIDRNCN